MIAAGCWSLEIRHKKMQILYSIYFSINYASYCCYFIFRFFGIIAFCKEGDWKLVGMALMYGASTLLTGMKCLLLRSKGVQNVIRMVYALEDDIYAGGDKAEISVYEESAKANTRRNILYFAAFSGGLFGVVILPLVRKEDADSRAMLRAMFDIWLPFDAAKHRLLGGFCLLYGISVGCGYYTGTGLFIFSLLSFCRGNLKLLQRRMRNIGRAVAQSSYDDERNVLEQCIHHHRRLIR